MLNSTRIVVALVLMLTATAAGAQVGSGRYGPAKGSGPQTGVQARRPEPAPVVRPSSHTAPVATPVAVRLVPAVLMSDGSILADFGFGLEHVRRACSRAVVSSGGKVIGGNGQVLSQPAPGLQPVPGLQPTPVQNAQPVSQRPPSRAALGSCFTRDGGGRVFVTK